MPTYEYRCKDCGEPLEVVQSFTDDALTECPACGGSLRKVFGNVGIAFKGSGFYKTDSRGSKATAGASSGSGSADGGSSSSDSSSSSSTDSSSSNGNGSSGTGGDAAKKADTKAPATTPST
ncbi:MAG TPA: FmdB family zinc ribbon protein [Acidimicrobiales bacterium]|jgi:putative FmdB family regulatory protein